MPDDRPLRYRAGPGAMEAIRRDGLTPESIAVLAGAASGPKWLVLAGIDRALLDSGLAVGSRDRRRRLLVGASAGAWRMLAFASRSPVAAHRRLLHGYVHQVFPRGVAPSQVSAAYRRMLGETFSPDDAARATAHPSVDLAVHVTRVRGLPRRASWWRHVPLLGLAGVLHAVSERAGRWILQRLLFHTRPGSFEPGFDGRILELNARNLPDVALASGTVPVVMDPVPSLDGAPPGPFVDGGLADYHLRQRYGGVTLFPHFQKEIVAVWFDRRLPDRRPRSGALHHVLQVHPNDEFTASLPGGRLPDREDFFTFVDAPEERIRRWNAVAAASERLGEAFTRDLEAGRVSDLLEPLEPRG